MNIPVFEPEPWPRQQLELWPFPVTEQPPLPSKPVPASGAFVYFGFQWLAITETKLPSGVWRFQMWEWVEDDWQPWFQYEHTHFASGWRTIERRARKALLEGERPELLVEGSQLASLNAFWREHGRHQLSWDNPHHDMLLGHVE